MLFKKLNVLDFDLIRSELEIFSSKQVEEQKRYWDVDWSEFESGAPSFYKFVSERKKLPIRACRFYLTPPWGYLKPHIDGLSDNRSPLGLNIPIIGCENTRMIWYSSPDDNFEDGDYGFNESTASRVIDFGLLKKIEETEITIPTFVRTDIAHGVINPKSTPRLVLSVRFKFIKIYGTEFHQVFNLDGL